MVEEYLAKRAIDRITEILGDDEIALSWDPDSQLITGVIQIGDDSLPVRLDRQPSHFWLLEALEERLEDLADQRLTAISSMVDARLEHIFPQSLQDDLQYRLRKLELEFYSNLQGIARSSTVLDAHARWLVPLGQNGLPVELQTLGLEKIGESLAATLAANVRIGNADISLKGAVEEDRLVIRGVFNSIALSDIAYSLFQVPPTRLDATLSDTPFAIDFEETSPLVALEKAMPWGMLRLASRKIGSRWVSALLIQSSDNWAFSILTPLKDYISHPKVTVATDDHDNFAFPALAAGEVVTDVRKGFVLDADLRLDHRVFKPVASFFKIGTLPITMTSPDDLQIVAPLGDRIDVVPGTLVFRKAEFRFKPQPLEVGVKGTAELTIIEKLPALNVGYDFIPANNAHIVSLSTEKPWERVFGLKNLTIVGLAFQITLGAGPAIFGGSGVATIAGTKFSFACLFLGNIPSVLSGSMHNDRGVKLSEIIRGLIDFPIWTVSFLEPTVTTLEMTYCSQPAAIKIQGVLQHFSPGLRLLVDAEMFSIRFRAEVIVDAGNKRLKIDGETDKINILDGLVTISSSEDTDRRGPWLTMDTNPPFPDEPFFAMSGKVTLLWGLYSSWVKASINKDNISYAFEERFGDFLTYRLTALFSGTKFKLDGNVACGIGDIKLPGGMGRIPVETGFSAHLVVEKSSDTFRWQISDGHITVLGVPLGPISFKGQLSVDDIKGFLEDPRAAFREEIERAARKLAELHNLGAYLEALAKGLIDDAANTAEHIASVMADSFKQGAQAIADQLKEIGFDSNSVRDALGSIGKLDDEIAEALRTFGNILAKGSRVKGELELELPAIREPSTGFILSPSIKVSFRYDVEINVKGGRATIKGYLSFNSNDVSISLHAPATGDIAKIIEVYIRDNAYEIFARTWEAPLDFLANVGQLLAEWAADTYEKFEENLRRMGGVAANEWHKLLDAKPMVLITMGHLTFDNLENFTPRLFNTLATSTNIKVDLDNMVNDMLNTFGGETPEWLRRLDPGPAIADTADDAVEWLTDVLGL